MTYRSGFGDGHPLSDPKRANEFLAQSKWWIPAGAESGVRIKTLEPEHLKNILCYLLDFAGSIAFISALGRLEENPDDVEGVVNPTPLFEHQSILDETMARRFLAGTKLFGSILQRLMKTGMPESSRPAIAPRRQRAPQPWDEDWLDPTDTQTERRQYR